MSVLAALLTGGCRQAEVADLSEALPELVPLQLSLSGIAATPQNRAAVESGAEQTNGTYPLADGTYDFGLYVFNTDDKGNPTTLQMEGYGNIAARATVKTENGVRSTSWEYCWDGSGNYQSVLSIDKTKSAILYAYHPYTKDAPADVLPQAIPFNTNGQRDWMVASAPVTASGTGAQATLAFSHIMTCIEVSLKNHYTGHINLTSVTLTDTHTDSRLCKSGTFDATASTEWVKSKTPTTSIPITSGTGNIYPNEYSSFYFIMPAVASYNGGFRLTFVFNGVDAATSYEIPVRGIDAEGFATGTKYTYQLTVDNVMKFQPKGTTDDTWYKHTEETDIPL